MQFLEARQPQFLRVRSREIFLGTFFYSNRLVLPGYLFSNRLNVEKERLDPRFRSRHAFRSMAAI